MIVPVRYVCSGETRMSALTTTTCPPLIEITPIGEVFATGMRRVEICGEYVRITFYSEREIGQGESERVVVARIVMPHVAFHVMARKLTGGHLRLV